MPKIKRTKKNYSASVTFDVHDYLTSLSKQKENASQTVDDAIRATPGFIKFQKGKNEKKN